MQTTPTTSLREVMAKVGELFLYWGYLESEVRNRISRLEDPENLSKKAANFGTLLKAWEEKERIAKATNLHALTAANEIIRRAEKLAEFRNDVAHNLCGAAADYSDANANLPVRAHIKLRRVGNEVENIAKIDFGALSEHVEAIDRLRLDIRGLA